MCVLSSLLTRDINLTLHETYFSLSPSHFDMRSEEETEKNVELLASVATALARYDFPVPGGPNNKMPLHGVRLPENTARSNEEGQNTSCYTTVAKGMFNGAISKTKYGASYSCIKRFN